MTVCNIFFVKLKIPFNLSLEFDGYTVLSLANQIYYFQSNGHFLILYFEISYSISLYHMEEKVEEEKESENRSGLNIGVWLIPFYRKNYSNF